MLYVYRENASTGARDLAEALDGLRWRGIRRPIQDKVRRGDTVVCWGETLAPIPGVRILNGGPVRDKLADAIRLREKGVSTIEVSRTQPQAPLPVLATDPAINIWEEAKGHVEEFLELDFTRNSPVYRQGVGDLVTALTRLHGALGTPVPRVAPAVLTAWIPRLKNHVGGNDLLTPPPTPDYWVKKETFTKEFRVHSFKGKSIRAGIKAAREGVANVHEWVRSWDGGWRIQYDGVSSKQKHRDIAHAAVAALELDFGAVDIGEKADGSLVVLEVNRAPGLDGGTIDKYAEAIRAWQAETPRG